MDGSIGWYSKECFNLRGERSLKHQRGTRRLNGKFPGNAGNGGINYIEKLVKALI